jgi:hypothetical protein
VGGERELQIPRLPPDFLSGLVVSVNRMRLSLEKAAYVAVFESSVVGNPEFARDDKGGGQRSPQQPLPRDGQSGRRLSAIFVPLGGPQVHHTAPVDMAKALVGFPRISCGAWRRWRSSCGFPY